MTKLLFIQASPRGAESKSIKIAETYLARLAAHNPDPEIDRLELWSADLPAFDGNKAAAKMNIFTGQQQEGATRTAWDEITEIAARFTSPAFGTDHHSTYIRDWLTQAGLTRIDELRFQPTLLTADPAGDLARVEASAIALADHHGAI